MKRFIKPIIAMIISASLFLYIYIHFPIFVDVLNNLIIPITSIATFVLIVLHRMQDSTERQKDIALSYRPILEFEYNPDFKDKDKVKELSKFNSELSFEIELHKANGIERKDRIKSYKEQYGASFYDSIPLCLKNTGNGHAKNIRFQIESDIITATDKKEWIVFDKKIENDNITILVSNHNYIICQYLPTIIHVPSAKSIQDILRSDDFKFNFKIKITYTDEFNFYEYTSTFIETIRFKKGTNLNDFKNLSYSIENVRLDSLDTKRIYDIKKELS